MSIARAVHESLLAGVLAVACAAAFAQTRVEDAWIRGTVPQQKATGMFARLTSAQGARLVSVSSTAAGIVEIHEMRMDGNVMRMRAMADGLELPAGKTVELRPGGYHVMFMDLKQPLKPGDMVPVSLAIIGNDGKRETLELNVPVRPMGAMATGSHGHKP